MTDPAAIDLEAINTKLAQGPLKTYDVLPLIAAVEALREREADWGRDRRALVNRVVTLTSRAEIAEAHAAELARAKDEVVKALKTLDATIVNALDGHRSGVLTSITGASQVYADEVLQESEIALANLDALNQGERGT